MAPDLTATWEILTTEAVGAGEAVRTVPSGIVTPAGEVEVGADARGVRYLLIPLQAGEAVREDRSGRWVQLVRTVVDGRDWMALTCEAHELHELFNLLAVDILEAVEGTASPAEAAFITLQKWRELFAPAPRPLSEAQLVGLLAELQSLEECFRRNPTVPLAVWAGPSGGKHDLQHGELGVEVKATVTREGRIVSINGIEQLDPAPGTHLYLAIHRYESSGAQTADCLPAAVDRLLHLGAPMAELYALLEKVGYRAADRQDYEERTYQLIERRVYDAANPSFPKLAPSSFANGGVPAGVLRVHYSIDLTNEPPLPLPSAEESVVWEQLAQGGSGG